MILVTVGSSVPFARLIKKMDELAPLLDQKVILQIGSAEYEPRHAEFFRYADELGFQKYLREADIVIGHAGMGTVLNMVAHEKKSIVVPRRKKYGEAINDHQVQSMKLLQERLGIAVAYDMDELEHWLLEKMDEIAVPRGGHERAGLVEALKRAIEE